MVFSLVSSASLRKKQVPAHVRDAEPPHANGPLSNGLALTCGGSLLMD